MDAADLIPLSPKDYLILFSLMEGDRHGYGLVKAVARVSRGRVGIDPANLYRSIKRMIRDGLVEESEDPPSADAGGGRRRYYTITKLGRAAVRLEAVRLAELTAAARAMDLIADEELPA